MGPCLSNVHNNITCVCDTWCAHSSVVRLLLSREEWRKTKGKKIHCTHTRTMKEKQPPPPPTKLVCRWRKNKIKFKRRLPSTYNMMYAFITLCGGIPTSFLSVLYRKLCRPTKHNNNNNIRFLNAITRECCTTYVSAAISIVYIYYSDETLKVSIV